MSWTDSLRDVRELDAQREGIPGEHLATFGTSLAVLQWALQRRSPTWRLAGFALTGLLVLRALTGRDGPIARLRRR
ncbi:MAG: hypothetical protein H7125_03810 [Proteobacteria bacterium]|nr:hypothetical protein [Burkholderiales bacterium]